MCILLAESAGPRVAALAHDTEKTLVPSSCVRQKGLAGRVGAVYSRIPGFVHFGLDSVVLVAQGVADDGAEVEGAVEWYFAA